LPWRVLPTILSVCNSNNYSNRYNRKKNLCPNEDDHLLFLFKKNGGVETFAGIPRAMFPKISMKLFHFHVHIDHCDSASRRRDRTQGAKAACERCGYLEGGEMARARNWHGAAHRSLHEGTNPIRLLQATILNQIVNLTAYLGSPPARCSAKRTHFTFAADRALCRFLEESIGGEGCAILPWCSPR